MSDDTMRVRGPAVADSPSGLTSLILFDVAVRYGGLHAGSHAQGSGEASIIEVWSDVVGVPWTNDPASVGLPNIRALNDAAWTTPGERAMALVPLAVAMTSVWRDDGLRRAFAPHIALRTVQVVLSSALRSVRLDDHAQQCEASETVEAAAERAAQAQAIALAAPISAATLKLPQ